MNSQLIRSALQGIVNLTISLKLGKSADKIANSRRILEDWAALGNLESQAELSDIFSKLRDRKSTEKELEKMKLGERLRLTFRTYSSYNYKEISSENWYFRIENTGKSQAEGLQKWHLKNYLLVLIDTIQELAMRREFSGTKTEKSVFTDYQIQYNCQQCQDDLLSNKIRLSLGLSGEVIKSTVVHNFNLSENQLSKGYGRKLSSDTNTSSSKTQSKLTRKLSLFSFYDQENDITILTDDNTVFEGEFEEESILVQDSDEQSELIETQQERKIREFKETLNQLSNSEPIF